MTLLLYRHLPHVAEAEAEAAHHHPLSRLAAASLARASHLKRRKGSSGGGGRASSLSKPAATAGLLIANTLCAPGLGRAVPSFVLGCSLVSVHQPPSGLAGFGRGAPSVPAQLRLPKLSYCLLSRRFDDNTAVKC